MPPTADSLAQLVHPIQGRWDLEFLHGDPNQTPPILVYGPEKTDDAEWMELDEIERAMAFHSLAACVDYLWPILHPGRPFKRGPHVDLICYALEQLAYGRVEGNELVIAIPPRMLKSIIVNVIFPAWVWLHSPQKVIMGISASEQVAIRDNRKMRELVESARYQRLMQTAVQIQTQHKKDHPEYEDLWIAQPWDLKKDLNQAMRFENDHKGMRFALAAGANIIGEGMDLQIIDDPVDAKKATEGSVEQRMENMAVPVARYGGTWSTRLQAPGKSPRVTIMQMLHEADLANELIRKGVPAIVLPMEYDPDHPNLCPLDWRTEPGQLLLESHYDQETLEKFKRPVPEGLGLNGYSAQFGQRPSPEAGGRFDRTDWRYFDMPPTQMARHILKHGGKVLASFDCASKDGASNAWSVCVVVGFLGSNMYVLDMYRDRVELPGLTALYDRMLEEWSGLVDRVLIEDASNGTALLQIRAGEGINPQKHGGKTVRAGYTESFQKSGRALLYRYGGWEEALKEEHARFPMGSYADIVDALAQAAMIMAIEKSETVVSNDIESKFGWMAQLANMDPQLRALFN